MNIRRYLLPCAALLISLTSCGYPLRAQPLLQGALRGHFYKNAYDALYDPSEEGSPVRLDAELGEFSEDRYTFEGVFTWDGQAYSISGFEETNSNLEYLSPQANLISGSVQAHLQKDDVFVYILCGKSRYGVGGGLSPEREQPVATFSMYSVEKEQCFGKPYLEPIGYVRLE